MSLTVPSASRRFTHGYRSTISRRVGSDPSKAEDPYPGLSLQDLADGYLYLGPIASIHQVEFPHETGTAYARELDRRRSLLGGSPIPIAPAPVPQ